MRIYFLFLVSIFLFLGCSTVSPFIDFQGKVSISSTSEVIPNQKVFHQASADFIRKQDFVEERGKYYLDRVVIGYSSQLPGVVFSEDTTQGLHFFIREIEVDQGHTLNIIAPGPVIKMKMMVDVYENERLITSESYKTRVNMALVVNEDKFWNWLTKEEVEAIDNQVKTFERGLRNLYRNLYFKHLDISLTL